MEYFMIKVPIGGETFYSVAKRKEAERRMARMALRESAPEATVVSDSLALPDAHRVAQAAKGAEHAGKDAQADCKNGLKS
jgi:hypothetical protein